MGREAGDRPPSHPLTSGDWMGQGQDPAVVWGVFLAVPFVSYGSRWASQGSQDGDHGPRAGTPRPPRSPTALPAGRGRAHAPGPAQPGPSRPGAARRRRRHRASGSSRAGTAASAPGLPAAGRRSAGRRSRPERRRFLPGARTSCLQRAGSAASAYAVIIPATTSGNNTSAAA
jgi:hypothetical protein